jgi:pimeloyl-ACP methyl ester carboxylesterase
VSLSVGALLIGWTAVQIVIDHAFSWWHPVGVLCGAALIVLGLDPTRRPMALGVVGVTGGAVLVAIGVGFVPHVLERTALGIAAVALTVGGLVLVVDGSRRLLGGRRWSTQTGAGVLVGLLVAVTAWLVAPSIAATNVPPSELGARPLDRDLEAHDVVVTTTDGVRLEGWLLPSEHGAAVVLLHGAGSTRSDVLDQATVLHRHGYGVLMIDARGHGESGGRAMDFGWYGDLDIAAATGYLADEGEIDPARIGVIGMSMGGEEAIGAAATDPLIGAVVAEGATGRTAADKAWLSDEYGWRGTLQEQIEKAQYWVADYLTAAAPPTALRSAIAASDDTPFLLIAAGDVDDETAAATYMAAAAPDRVTVWTVDGASHTAGLDTAPDDWEDRVIGFLDRHLRGAE